MEVAASLAVTAAGADMGSRHPWCHHGQRHATALAMTAADEAAGAASLAVTAAGADMRSRRPWRHHGQQQRHKRRAAELRIDAVEIYRRLQMMREQLQRWELR